METVTKSQESGERQTGRPAADVTMAATDPSPHSAVSTVACRMDGDTMAVSSHLTARYPCAIGRSDGKANRGMSVRVFNVHKCSACGRGIGHTDFSCN